ncbi:MAG: CPBP family intramembrane metalloprotease [Acidobacteriia bacterium]|nr:CPBP family intramembrane metalloprotease [Terriglobia bacterium]
MIKRHPLLVFFVLAFLLSWYPWLIALARHTTTGPNPLGPMAAALIVAGIVGRGAGVKELLGRLVRARVGWSWYAVALLLPVVVCGTAAAIAVLLGAPRPDLTHLPTWREVVNRFVFILLFIGLGEETGWRGFALPQLQRHHSPMVASLILAPIWALWHLPLMGTEFAPPIIPAFLIAIVPATVLATWIFNHTRGSVLLQMLFHTTVNTVTAGAVFPLFAQGGSTALWYAYAGVWVLVTVVVVRAGGLRKLTV